MNDKPSLGIKRLSWLLSSLAGLATFLSVINFVTDSNWTFLAVAPFFWGTIAFLIPFTLIRLSHWVYRGFKQK